MNEKQKSFMELISRMLPNMTELEQERLLAFGEGMAFMADRIQPTQPPAERPGA